MASAAVEERLEKVKALNSYLESVEDRLRAIANELSWNYDALSEEAKDESSSVATCSIRPEHRVKSSRISEHEDKCSWAENGYRKDEIPFPEFTGSGSCVVFTPELHERVARNANPGGSQSLSDAPCRQIPQTSARYDQEFSREEKLALYEYVIANTKKTETAIVDFSPLTSKEEKSEKKVMTPLEIAAAERDAKRRRASYRNKVHTNRKTQTEILREVIESQMDALREEMSHQSEENGGAQMRRNSDGSRRRDKMEDSRHEADRSERRRRRDSHDDADSSRERRHRSDRGKSKRRKRSRSRSRSRDRDKRRKSSHRSSR